MAGPALNCCPFRMAHARSCDAADRPSPSWKPPEQTGYVAWRGHVLQATGAGLEVEHLATEPGIRQPEAVDSLLNGRHAESINQRIRRGVVADNRHQGGEIEQGQVIVGLEEPQRSPVPSTRSPSPSAHQVSGSSVPRSACSKKLQRMGSLMMLAEE